jgi:N-acetylmuramoyl-L-alanine amidase
MMQVADGLLDGGELVDVDTSKVPSWGKPIVPEVIVIHYAVTNSIDATVAAQVHSGFKAHLSFDGYCRDVDGDGKDDRILKVSQLVKIGHRGAHTGKSSLDGRKGVNAFSVGFEIANPGPLIEKGDKLYTTYGKEWKETDGLVIKASHPYPFAPKAWQHWVGYTEEEMLLIAEASKAIVKEFPTIHQFVGHSEISPGRKFDPGPAFDMVSLRKAVFRR